MTKQSNLEQSMCCLTQNSVGPQRKFSNLKLIFYNSDNYVAFILAQVEGVLPNFRKYTVLLYIAMPNIGINYYSGTGNTLK